MKMGEEVGKVNAGGNRTEEKALKAFSDMKQVPEKFFYPSDDKYVGSFDYMTNEIAYLELIKEGIDVHFDKSSGQLMFNGNPATKVDLENIDTNEPITELNTMLLRGLFSIIWFNIKKDLDSMPPIPTEMDAYKFYQQLDRNQECSNLTPLEQWLAFDRYWNEKLDTYSIRLYAPKLMSYLSPNSGFDEEKFEALKKEMEKLDRIRGVMKIQMGNRVYNDRYHILVLDEDEESTNTIVFHSPYMSRLARDMLRDTTRVLTRNGKAMLDKNGSPIYLPTVTTVMQKDVLAARDKRAAELALQLAAFLKVRSTNNKVVNIKATTLVGMGIGLREALIINDDDKEAQRRLLRRTFTDMWKYLKEYSDIGKMFDYEEIIPTVKNYDKVTLKFYPQNGSASKAILDTDEIE